MRSIEILEDVSFRVIHFVDPNMGLKKIGQQNKGALILKWRVEAPAAH